MGRRATNPIRGAGQGGVSPWQPWAEYATPLEESLDGVRGTTNGTNSCSRTHGQLEHLLTWNPAFRKPAKLLLELARGPLVLK